MVWGGDAEGAVDPAVRGAGQCSLRCASHRLLLARGTWAALGTQAHRAQMDCQGCRVSRASGVRPAPKARR